MGSVEMVQLLVAEEADKDGLTSRLTPLTSAVKGHDAVAQALLAAGVDANLRGGGILSALDVAAVHGRMRVVSAVIEHVVDVNDASQELDEDTALRFVAEMNQPAAADILAVAGAKTEARNAYGCAPLHSASRDLSREAAAALIKHGADIDARGRYKRTPLHEAAGQAGKPGAVEMVDLLLRRGADEKATDHKGKTPADVAGHFCYRVQEVGGVERVRKLLANAPVAREAWRRRGLLVAARARPQMVMLNTGKRPHGEWMVVLFSTRKRPRREWRELMRRLLGLAEEGIFRTIVGYL